MTNANSSKAPKTNVKHTPVHTSMAFVYDTGGSDALIPDVCVAMVSRVVTPDFIVLNNEREKRKKKKSIKAKCCVIESYLLYTDLSSRK